MYAVDSRDGSVKWSYATRGAVLGGPAIGADGTLFVGSSDGRMYAFGGGGPSASH